MLRVLVAVQLPIHARQFVPGASPNERGRIARVTERLKFTLKGEAIDVFNRHRMGLGDTEPNDGCISTCTGFGIPTTVDYGPLTSRSAAALPSEIATARSGLEPRPPACFAASLFQILLPPWSRVTGSFFFAIWPPVVSTCPLPFRNCKSSFVRRQ